MSGELLTNVSDQVAALINGFLASSTKKNGVESEHLSLETRVANDHACVWFRLV
jgi:hypothetical protein